MNGTLLPQLSQDEVIKHRTLTTKPSSCAHVPFLPWRCTEFQSDYSAFNLCVVVGVQCRFGIINCGKVYKCIPVWRGRFKSAQRHKGCIQLMVICNGISRIRWKGQNIQTYPLDLPWLVCGILMKEAFLNTSWRVSSVAAYERLLTIKVFDSLSAPHTKRSQWCKCRLGEGKTHSSPKILSRVKAVVVSSSFGGEALSQVQQHFGHLG